MCCYGPILLLNNTSWPWTPSPEMFPTRALLPSSSPALFLCQFLPPQASQGVWQLPASLPQYGLRLGLSNYLTNLFTGDHKVPCQQRPSHLLFERCFLPSMFWPGGEDMRQCQVEVQVLTWVQKNFILRKHIVRTNIATLRFFCCLQKCR